MNATNAEQQCVLMSIRDGIINTCVEELSIIKSVGEISASPAEKEKRKNLSGENMEEIVAAIKKW